MFEQQVFMTTIDGCPEVVLYFLIDQLGAFIWRMNHDMADGRIEAKYHAAIDRDLDLARKQQKQAVQQCERFGVPQPIDSEGAACPKYWLWYRWWDKWKKGLSDDEWEALDAVLSCDRTMTEGEINKYRPPGGWQTQAAPESMEEKVEIDRLRDGYKWLEGLAEGREIGITVSEADGTLTISTGIHQLYAHVDLADLCMQEAAKAAKGEGQTTDNSDSTDCTDSA